MLTTGTLAAFVTATVILNLVPGPSMVFLLARGLSHGRPVAVRSALGLMTSASIFVAATALGVTAILASSALAFAVVRWLGVAYLLFLGVQTLLKQQRPTGRHTERGVYRQAFIVGISNPKTAVFFLAFFPQFVDPARGPAAAQILFLGLLFVLIGAVFDLSYALTAGTLRSRLLNRPDAPTWMRRISGSLYLLLGGWLAASGSR
ncbi:LysE family translocator [Actinomadura rudentiformis]|uniref:LysE family translocator n=1 Tax=Actinomadura rudentiformis TaxID=359158 RepID=A0A6H9YVH7_9ACTN|nr:LysE family translocator [Actinomadura rudentiformis]KAB2352561.1 LysE family translocator [Actinomadura rudentiformis]